MVHLRNWRGALSALCLATTLPGLSMAASVIPPAGVQTQPVVKRLDGHHFAIAVKARFGQAARSSWSDFYQRPTALRRLDVATQGEPVAAARAFVLGNRDLLGLGEQDLFEGRRVADGQGATDGTVVIFDQRYQGLAVQDRSVTVRLDAAGHIRGLRLNTLPVAGVPAPSSATSAESARHSVATAFGLDASTAVGTPALVVLAHPHAASCRLAYRVPTAYLPMTAHFMVWVDAHSGEVLQQAPVNQHQSPRQMPLKSKSKAEVSK